MTHDPLGQKIERSKDRKAERGESSSIRIAAATAAAAGESIPAIGEGEGEGEGGRGRIINLDCPPLPLKSGELMQIAARRWTR